MSSICLPPAIPKPNRDCLDLHRALEGVGCDGQAVIRIVGHRDAYQRSQIKAVYRNMYQEDICRRLKSELHRHFEKAMLMWMRDAPERDAIILRGALKSKNALRRNRIVAETLSTKSMDELDSITKVYDRLYGRPLQNDIETTLTGPSQKLFVLYLHGNRDETNNLEPYIILEEATKLHSALSTNIIDETTFIRVLTTTNHRQLCSIFDAYRTTYGHHIYEALKQKSTTEFHKVVRIITKCISSPEDYFAKVLYKSMKGLGTDDDTLIRVVVTRAEIDMTTIKVAFFRRYKKALSTMISSDTTGSYRKFLLALVGAPY